MDSGYVSVGEQQIYYESRGDGGTPLVLVHGGFGVTDAFGEVRDALAENRRVIAIELQGHGHTADVSRPFTWEGFGDDIAGVITGLGLATADLLGYSLGGGACLRAAIQHPELVRRLVLVSAPHKRDGWFPEVLAGMSATNSSGIDFMRQTPIYSAYADRAPDVSAFGALMDKTGDLLRTPYDWSNEVAALEGPVLLVYGDADGISPAVAAEFYGLLGGGLRDAGWDRSALSAHRLAVLPDVTHYEAGSSPQLVAPVTAFLDRT